jgi:aspartate carbamoyltransferase catalytic subunit
MQLQRKDILDIASLSVAEIELILDTATQMREISSRPIKKVPTLRGRTVVHFFYEPSTRTKTSFDVAAKRLSADSLSLSKSTSSIVKGETLIDTAKNLDAMAPDAIVIRHSSAGAPHLIARHVRCGVINAGDGRHAHPTQALLDMLTVCQYKGRLDGLRIAIIGDIAHSRVARSNCEGFVKMGAEVVLCGPPTMIPKGIESYGVSVTGDVDEAIADADVIMLLRIQKERQQAGLFPSEREYARVYGINRRRLERARGDVLIMHPGPVNRGVELAPDVADGPFSVILEQVANGVAVRMALLLLVAGGTRNENQD